MLLVVDRDETREEGELLSSESDGEVANNITRTSDSNRPYSKVYLNGGTSCEPSTSLDAVAIENLAEESSDTEPQTEIEIDRIIAESKLMDTPLVNLNTFTDQNPSEITANLLNSNNTELVQSVSKFNENDDQETALRMEILEYIRKKNTQHDKEEGEVSEDESNAAKFERKADSLYLGLKSNNSPRTVKGKSKCLNRDKHISTRCRKRSRSNSRERQKVTCRDVRRKRLPSERDRRRAEKGREGRSRRGLTLSSRPLVIGSTGENAGDNRPNTVKSHNLSAKSIKSSSHQNNGRPLSRSADHVDMVLGEGSSPQIAESTGKKCPKKYELPPPPPPPLPYPSSAVSPVIPPPPPPPPDELMVRANNSHDNYEDVGMDIESGSSASDDSERSENIASVLTRGKRMSSELDEDLLRQMLLNQVTSRRMNNQSESYREKLSDEAANKDANPSLQGVSSTSNQHISSTTIPSEKSDDTSNPHATSMPKRARVECVDMAVDSGGVEANENTSKEADTEEMESAYRAKRSLLFGLDARVAEKMSYLEEAACKREKLMKSVEELTAKINVAYVECNHLMDKREKTRDEVQQYEREKLSRLIDSRRVNDLSLRISNSNLMVSLLHERKIKNSRDAGVDERDVSTNGGYQKECAGGTRQMEDDSSMDEEEMRRKLLERMRHMKEAKVQVKNITFHGRSEDLNTEGTVIERDNDADRRVEDVINGKRNEDVQCTTEENISTGRINETDTDSDREDTDSGIQRVSEGDPLLSFASFRLCRGFPLRLLTHVGVTNNLNPILPLCPFELMGKCKDVTCEWQHAHDYRMSDRDILAMVLQYAPEIAEPRLAGLSLSQRVDAVLSWRKEGQSLAKFIRSLLRTVPCEKRKIRYDVHNELVEHDKKLEEIYEYDSIFSRTVPMM